MIKILLSFLISASMFGQIGSLSSKHKISDEAPLSSTTSLIGYNFYEGGFMRARLSNTQQFHFGIVHTYVENYKILEVPIIVKQELFANFYTFFGARLNSTINADFGKSALSKFTKPTLGGSFEMGFQYDVNPNLMFEMQYNLPTEQGALVFPSSMDYNNRSLFKLGSKIEF